MRLMQIMAGGPAGGAEAFFERLTAGLARAGETQTVVIRRDPARAARLREAGLDPVELAFGGPLDWRTRPRIAALIRREKPEAVVAWMNRAALKTPKLGPALIGRLGGYYDLKYYRHCDHLVGNTPDIVDYMVREGWPRDRAHYLPNFVDAAPATAVPRDSLDTPDDVPLLLALGRLHPNKAFDVLIPALAQVPRAVLWLAGEGPEEKALKRLAQEQGVADRVRFLGWRQDAGALIEAADVVVVPSRKEPLGNVVLEAFARGKPVVAAGSEGPRALIADRQSGLLVPVDDADSLAAALNVVMRDGALSRRIAEGGRKTYEARFAEDNVVAAWRDFLSGVAR